MLSCQAVIGTNLKLSYTKVTSAVTISSADNFVSNITSDRETGNILINSTRKIGLF